MCILRSSRYVIIQAHLQFYETNIIVICMLARIVLVYSSTEIDKNTLPFAVVAIGHVIDGHLVNSVALFLVERS